MKNAELSDFRIESAEFEDAEEILALQMLAYRSEAKIYDDYQITPLLQTLEEIQADFRSHTYLKAVINGRIVGSVRGISIRKTCHIGRLIVHPDYQNQGIGTLLMAAIEAKFPDVLRFELFTGHRSNKNLYLYRKLGYKVTRVEPLSTKVSLLFMDKLCTDRN